MIKQIETIQTAADLIARLDKLRGAGKTIGLVPTMGALHEGHLSLVRASLAGTDVTLVTVFVNPMQFGPAEDLSEYPRPLETDIARLNELGADIVFVPTGQEIYPPRFSTTVNPPDVARKLEGEFRPTHFQGVCTVVLKLFNLAKPDLAYFGQKDFQQVCVLQDMVTDLNVPVTISVCPIVREADGLALSSRNVYLSEDERAIALSLNRTLKHVRQMIQAGQRDGYAMMTEMQQMLIDGGVTSVDYAVIADPMTLIVQEQIQRPAVSLIAAHVGKTRLIDNDLIEAQ